MLTPSEIRAAKKRANQTTEDFWTAPGIADKHGLIIDRSRLVEFLDTALAAIAERDAAMAVLREIRAVFETVTPLAGRSYASTHAAHNLDGAIISIEHNGNMASPTTMSTLKRVAEQLSAIDALLKDIQALRRLADAIEAELEADRDA